MSVALIPNATIVHSIRGGLRLAYKAHVAVSGKKGLVVTAAIATTGIASEEHLLNEVLRCHTRHTEIPVKEVVADTRYGTLANYVSLDQEGIVAFIPPHERTNGVNGFWGKDYFRYVPEQDIYLCPAGKTMKRFGMCEGKKRHQSIATSIQYCKVIGEELKTWYGKLYKSYGIFLEETIPRGIYRIP